MSSYRERKNAMDGMMGVVVNKVFNRINHCISKELEEARKCAKVNQQVKGTKNKSLTRHGLMKANRFKDDLIRMYMVVRSLTGAGVHKVLPTGNVDEMNLVELTQYLMKLGGGLKEEAIYVHLIEINGIINAIEEEDQ